MALSRKTFGAISGPTSGTTISPAYGATPVANNLLIAVCFASGQSSNNWSAAPSGWTKAWTPNSDGVFAVCIYTKVAAGGDAAPTFTYGSTATLNAFIVEVQGATFNASSAVEAKNMATASGSSPVTATADATDIATGNYVLSVILEQVSTAGTDTTTQTFNN